MPPCTTHCQKPPHNPINETNPWPNSQPQRRKNDEEKKEREKERQSNREERKKEKSGRRKNVEVQNVERSQIRKSKKDLADGNEKRKKAWPLK